MNLIVDIGNTRVKLALTDGETGEVVKYASYGELRAFELSALLEEHEGEIERAIVCATGTVVPVLLDTLRRKVPYTLVMDAVHTDVPIKNLYGTPETLGQDRLAAAVGATVVFPGRNALVVDFGTAITIDVVTARGEYIGGNISPGMDMRFRALNEFTDKLPLCDHTHGETLVANNTVQAIEGGVVNGIEFEIGGYIERLKGEYDDLAIIFTGGGAEHFAERFKNTIFANYDLVVIGLNRILNYNADKK